MSPKYPTFDDFTREQIRPGLRAGWTIDDINDPTDEEHDFDLDPFEEALRAAEYEEEDEDEE
ncbi:MAG TPA: hypothetical protein VHM70_24800 [Polyangiaceae bacterium]|jgi:hypothetical protein|nr:hypothetical protein [Polyangiaceae bacterium]